MTRDLGIQIDNKASFKQQRSQAILKTSRKAAWALRTFRSRSPDLMETLWRTIIQPHQDYSSQLWSPVARAGDLAAQEAPLRAFTKRVDGLHSSKYWDRLAALHLFSTERRQERYKLLYTWKALTGTAPNYGLELAPTSIRRGRLLRIPSSAGGAGVRTLRDGSLQVEGPRLFNCLPSSIRDLKVDPTTFKVILDLFLQQIPDHPDGPGDRPEALTNDGHPSNSIKDWMRVTPALASWTPPKELLD